MECREVFGHRDVNAQRFLESLVDAFVLAIKRTELWPSLSKVGMRSCIRVKHGHQPCLKRLGSDFFYAGDTVSSSDDYEADPIILF